MEQALIDTLDANTRALIEQENWRQALKSVDKALKKKPQDLSLLAVRATITYYTGNIAKCETYFNEVIASSNLKDTRVLQELSVLGLTLGREHGTDTLGQIDKAWRGAIKAQATSKEQTKVAKEYAYLMAEQSVWGSFAKAALELRRLAGSRASKSRMYFYWHVLGLQLSANALSYKLAARMMDQALDGKGDAPVVSNLEEMGMIIRFIGFNSELDADMQKRMTSSPAAKQDLELYLYCCWICANNARETDNWRLCENITITALCELLLQAEKNPNTVPRCLLDQWEPWLNLTLAYSRLGTTELRAQIQTILDRFMALDSTLRCTHLFKVYLSIVDKTVRKGKSLDEKFKDYWLQCVEDYFLKYSDDLCCDSGLHYSIVSMNGDEFCRLRERITDEVNRRRAKDKASKPNQLNWVVRELNSLKLDYNWLRAAEKFEASDDERTQKLRIKMIEAFTGCCLRLYETGSQHITAIEKTDPDPVDEACLLAANGLALLENLQDVPARHIQATVLIQGVCEQSYTNGLSYVRLMRQLKQEGFTSLAWKVFEKLRIRSILNEDGCDQMFSRIATSHPFATKDIDILERLNKHLGWYDASEQRIPQYVRLALECGNCARAGELVLFAKSFKNSFTRRLMIGEKRFMCLIRHPMDPEKRPYLSAPMPAALPPTSPDIVSKGRACRDAKPVSTDENPEYLQYLEYCGEVFTYATAKTLPGNIDLYPTIEPKALTTDIDKMIDLSVRDGLTLMEQTAFIAAQTMKQLMVLLTMNEWTVDQLLRACLCCENALFPILESLPGILDRQQSRETPLIYNGSDLNVIYTAYLTLMAARGIVDKANEALKPKKKKGNNTKTVILTQFTLKKLDGGIMSAFEFLRKKSQNIVNKTAEGMKAKDYVTPFFKSDTSTALNDELGRDILKIVGTDSAHDILESFWKSSRESCEGLLKLQWPEKAIGA